MVNPDHLALLSRRASYNGLREAISTDNLDLSEADLRGFELQYFDLNNADLRGADLSGVLLTGTILRGANLSSANLKGAWLALVDLSMANLSGANLDNARIYWSELHGADLKDAALSQAVVSDMYLAQPDRSILRTSSSLRGFSRGDLSMVKNLSQSQVDSMIGDTGVLLPEGLKHPDHWPEWGGDETEGEEDKASEAEAEIIDENGLDGSLPPDTRFDGFDLGSGPYVFLSYQSSDREKIADYREKLIAEGIPCWWDQDIEPGDQWRSLIKGSLETATVVLTFWTENSVGSDAVKEEASTAQKARKFSHVRLDNSELPYGYAETQYLSLVDWDGDVEDPRWKRLVSVLKDRLNPPKLPSKISRIANTGLRTAVLYGGRIDVVDTPPDGKPEIEDEKIKNQIFEDIVLNCEDLEKMWELEPPQTSRKIMLTIDSAKSLARDKKPNWFSWDRLKAQLKRQLDNEDPDAWRGFDIEVPSLIDNIDQLRKVLKPTKLDASEGKPSSQQPPEISLHADSKNDISQLSNEIGELLSDPAVSVLTEEAQQQLAEDKAELDEGLDQEENPNEEVQARRFSLWRYALRGIAGFVATAVTVLTGTAVNLLTSPEAATTLLGRLEQLLEVILKFF